MAKTVVGVFEDKYEAEMAAEALIRNGFNDSDIDLSATSSDSMSDRPADWDMNKDSDKNTSAIGRFFSSLFDDHDEADQYRNVGEKGCVLTVHAHSSEEAHRAADILDQYGASDTDESGTLDGDYTKSNSYAGDRFSSADLPGTGMSGSPSVLDESGYSAGGANSMDTNFNRTDEANISTAGISNSYPDNSEINRSTAGADVSNTYGLGPDAIGTDRTNYRNDSILPDSTRTDRTNYSNDSILPDAIGADRTNYRDDSILPDASGTDRTNYSDDSILPSASGITGSGIEAGESKKIPVIQEEMQVGKREVETGGVRLKSRIFDRPVEENLRLRKERVSVERNPANRIATEADFNAFKEGTIETTETAEVPVVSKESRVVEEVNLRKEVEEKDEKIRGSVRRQDVEVESKKRDREFTGDDDALI